MAGLKVTLLGGFDARLPSGSTLNLPTKKAQALLAYLSVGLGHIIPAKSSALLWSDRSDHQARGALRHALVALRRALASTSPPALLVEGQMLALEAGTVLMSTS